MGRPYFIPAPTGGLNTRDPLLTMPETDAQTLDNMICEPGYVRFPGPVSPFCDTGAGDVETLRALRLESGSEVLLAIASDNKFWQIDTGTPADRSATYDATAAMTESYWQTCVYRHRIFGCNGVDRPFAWTGSGDVQLAAFTGPASNATKLIGVQPYKSRLYFVEKANASYWYTTNVDAVTGALVEVPMDSLLHLGGYFAFAGSSSNRLGDASAELFVLFSTEGEVLIYQGRFPGDASWSIVGRYFLPKPLCHRCYCYIDNKLYLITRQGPIGIHELLSGVNPCDPFQLESGKVQQAFIDAAVAQSATFETYKHCSGVHHKGKNYAVFTVPTVTSFPDLYVVNTTTRAWSRIFDPQGYCWEVFGEALYYGASGGAVGKFDLPINTAQASQANLFYIKHANSFLGNAKSSKKVTLIQPLFSVDSNSSSSDVIEYGADFDLSPTSTLNSHMFNYTSTTSFQKPILPLVGDGKSVAVRLELDSVSDDLDFRYYGSWVQVEDSGGIA